MPLFQTKKANFVNRRKDYRADNLAFSGLAVELSLKMSYILFVIKTLIVHRDTSKQENYKKFQRKKGC